VSQLEWQDYLEEKALGQLGLQIGAMLKQSFDCYGLGVFIPGMVEKGKRL
jgi:hypothetical protein